MRFSYLGDTFISVNYASQPKKIDMTLMDQNSLSGRQLAAARTLIGKTQSEIATAARISVPTLKRMEASEGNISGMTNNVAAVVQALLDLGIIFVPSNGNGPGVRLRDRT